MLVPIPGGNQGSSKYRAQWNSGNRSEVMQPQTWWQQIENGRVQLPIGDGPYRLQLNLRTDNHGQNLGNVLPKQVLSTDGTVAVQVPDEEWKKALAELEKRKNKQ